MLLVDVEGVVGTLCETLEQKDKGPRVYFASKGGNLKAASWAFIELLQGNAAGLPPCTTHYPGSLCSLLFFKWTRT